MTAASSDLGTAGAVAMTSVYIHLKVRFSSLISMKTGEQYQEGFDTSRHNRSSSGGSSR